MFTNTKSVLYVVIMLGTTSVALAAPRYPTDRQAGAVTRTHVPTSTYGSDSVPQAPRQISLTLLPCTPALLRRGPRPEAFGLRPSSRTGRGEHFGEKIRLG